MMALSRSASGPAGLSINTGQANLFGTSSSQAPAGGSLFGASSASTSQPAQSGGLFGSTATSQPAQSGGLFGASNQTSQPAQSGGLFGSTATATSQPAQSGGLFGASNTTSQPAPSGGLLFGSSNATSQPAASGGLFGSIGQGASQPQQSGGLFGSTNTQNTQSQPATGGLFGAKPAQTQAGGGLFGNNTTATSQPSGGLFGSSIATSQAQKPGGLFGGSTTNTFGSTGAAAAGGGLFGKTAAQPAQQGQTGLFGASQTTTGPGLTMGQSTNQQTVPGVRIDVSNIKGTTRFNDLQEDLQKEIIKFDSFIQNCMQQKEQVDAFMPAHGEQLQAIPGDVKFVGRKYEGAAGALHGDAQTIAGLRDLYKTDVENAKLSWKAVDNLKLPTQYHTSGLWSTRQQATPANGEAGEGHSDLINFFSKTGDEMEEQLRKFQKNLGEIESHMHGVQSNLLEQLQRAASQHGSNGSIDDRVAELAGVLREFESSILQVAGSVGSAREGMTELQLGDFIGNGRRR